MYSIIALPEFQSINYENKNPMIINNGINNPKEIKIIVIQKNILAPLALVPWMFASSGESLIT